jgi:hypothetical protein
MKKIIATIAILGCWSVNFPALATEITTGNISFRYNYYKNKASKAEIFNIQTKKSYPVLVDGPHEGYINLGDQPMTGLDNERSQLVAIQYTNLRKISLYTSEDQRVSCRKFQLDWKQNLKGYYIKGYWNPQQQTFSLSQKVSCPSIPKASPPQKATNTYTQKIKQLNAVISYSPPETYGLIGARQGYFSNEMFKFHNNADQGGISISIVNLKQFKKDQNEFTSLNINPMLRNIGGKNWYIAGMKYSNSAQLHAYYLDTNLLENDVVINILMFNEKELVPSKIEKILTGLTIKY